jgi:hypothetical protein
MAMRSATPEVIRNIRTGVRGWLIAVTKRAPSAEEVCGERWLWPLPRISAVTVMVPSGGETALETWPISDGLEVEI